MIVMPTPSAIIRSDVRTILDHVFDFRTFERACRTLEQGTDNFGARYRTRTAARTVRMQSSNTKRDTLEHMFDNGDVSG